MVLIDEAELLPALFGHVLLPPAVLRELQHPRTPPKVREWISHMPLWLEVRAATSNVMVTLAGLDAGEREAIQLALEQGIGTVLLDEAEGRLKAQELRLEVRGTLGILERGARLGKLNFREALGKLEHTNFRISPATRAAFLKRNS
jgi:predicted nucleic acid-binding protein